MRTEKQIRSKIAYLKVTQTKIKEYNECEYPVPDDDIVYGLENDILLLQWVLGEMEL